MIGQSLTKSERSTMKSPVCGEVGSLEIRHGRKVRKLSIRAEPKFKLLINILDVLGLGTELSAPLSNFLGKIFRSCTTKFSF